jgi:general secretion pathway protein C
LKVNSGFFLSIWDLDADTRRFPTNLTSFFLDIEGYQGYYLGMGKGRFYLICLVSIIVFDVALARILCGYIEGRLRMRPGEKDHSTCPIATSLRDRTRPLEDYSIIRERNIFKTEDTQGIRLSTKPGVSPLDLRLRGTVIFKERDPVAIIEDLKTNQQKAYRLGQRIKDWRIVSISRGKVVLERRGRTESLEIDYQGEATETQFTRRLAGNKRVISKTAILNRASEMHKALSKIEVAPYHINGKVEGVKVRGIEPGGPIWEMGIKNGDVIRRVNGYLIDNAKKAIEVAKKLKRESEIKLELQRNGKIETLTYSIRD